MPLYVAIGEAPINEVGSRLRIVCGVHNVYTAENDEDALRKARDFKWISIFFLYKIESNVPINPR